MNDGFTWLAKRSRKKRIESVKKRLASLPFAEEQVPYNTHIIGPVPNTPVRFIRVIISLHDKVCVFARRLDAKRLLLD